MVNECALEEKCSMCGNAATHKVGEYVPDEQYSRHEFSNYLCCHHFGVVLGKGAQRYCENKHVWNYTAPPRPDIRTVQAVPGETTTRPKFPIIWDDL